MILEPTIVVVNNGSRTAYDVVVVVDLVSPEKSHFNLNFQAYVEPVGSVSLESNGRSLRWTIPVLRGRQREEFLLWIQLIKASEPHPSNAIIFDKTLYVHEFYGEVTTSSFESSIREGNNTSRIWTYRYIVKPATTIFRRGEIIQSMCQWTNCPLHRGTPSISP